MRIRFSILRVLVGLGLFAASLTYYRNTPDVGTVVGSVLGTALFMLALLARKSNALVIVRSYLFTIIGVVIAMALTPPNPGSRHVHVIEPLAGALVASFVAGLFTMATYPKLRSPDRSDLDTHDR